MSDSRIGEIIDYTASRAALIPGVASVAGMGAELYDDPHHPGQKIQAGTEWPAEPFTHQSMEPSAPSVAPYTQDGQVEVTWTIPMRLWVQKAPVNEVRRQLLPFYARYLRVFGTDFWLSGLCESSRIRSFTIGSTSGDWDYLQVDLEVKELIDYV